MQSHGLLAGEVAVADGGVDAPNAGLFGDNLRRADRHVRHVARREQEAATKDAQANGSWHFNTTRSNFWARFQAFLGPNLWLLFPY